MKEKTITSRVSKVVLVDLNRHRHQIEYTANDIDPTAVKIDGLTDIVTDLLADGVGASATKGVIMRTASGEYKVNDFIVSDCLTDIIADLQQIVAHIETGAKIVELHGFNHTEDA